MEQLTRFVGLDVHKETITVAVTAAGVAGKATPYGRIPNTTAALEKLVAKLREAGSGPLQFCYEAGPCGYGVYRVLTQLGEACLVAAPSMIPRRSGDRQKNDKRDACALAMLHRGGLLTAVWVPDEAHEAMRDLIRARLAAVHALRAARQQLSAFLLRQQRVYAGRTCWTRAHRRWLAEQSFPEAAQHIVLEESIEAVRQAEQRRDRVEAQLRAQIPNWSLAPLVRNLAALRGIDVIGGAGITAAIGDPARFVTARNFMAYLGLVPSEHSSGSKRRLGAITKTGDVHARTLLVEAAWTYRFAPRKSVRKLDTLEAVPETVREIAWKAQLRLCQRYRSLTAAGKPKQMVVTAVARELAGFVWAIACATSDCPGGSTGRACAALRQSLDDAPRRAGAPCGLPGQSNAAQAMADAGSPL